MSEIVRGVTQLVLPWPPSTNSYWQPWPIGTPVIIGGVRYLKNARACLQKTKRASEYISDVAVAIRQQLGRARITPYRCPVRVDIELRPPDNRTRDLDNHAGKGLYDALTQAGIWIDDSQVREMTARFAPVKKGGECTVIISSLDSEVETITTPRESLAE